MKPAIYLTNPGGMKAGRGGPGRPHLITICPPAWLLKISSRLCLSGTPPNARMMTAARKGTLPTAEYEAACRAHWAKRPQQFRPGNLLVVDAERWVKGRQKVPAGPVLDGDTLLCVCGADGPCHRCWLAEVLDGAGWRVVLDGRERGTEPPEQPVLQTDLFAPRTEPAEPSPPEPAPDPEPEDEEDELPPVPECWRVVENIRDPQERLDLPLSLSEAEAWAVVARQVQATGRSWRLYRISSTGAWTPYGLPLDLAGLRAGLASREPRRAA
jgi:hypothetical protein